MTKLIVSLIKSHKKALISKLFLATLLALLLSGQTNAQIIDTTPPEIREFSFSPSVIDTTDSDQTVTVTIRVADPESEVFGASVFFVDPTMYKTRGVSLHKENLISGDSKDGVYRATAVFPQYSKAGTWVVSSVIAGNSIRTPTGNIQSYVTHLSTFGLVARGFATRLEVISNNEDVTPPEISEFRFTPETISISSTETRTVTFTVRAKDTQSGVASVYVLFLVPGSYLQNLNCGVSMSSNDRISGDEKDGVYQKTVALDCGTSSATLFASVRAFDKISNSSFLSAMQLATRGYSSQITIIGAPRRPRRTTFRGLGGF